MSDVGFVGTTAVAGIGATEFSKASGRSEMQLACEATVLALEDAGIEPAEVDGMVTFTADTNPEIEIARLTGIGDLKFFSRIHHGGGAACGTVQQAAMAVAEGIADVVVVYRAFNERSGHRFGTGVQDRPPACRHGRLNRICNSRYGPDTANFPGRSMLQEPWNKAIH